MDASAVPVVETDRLRLRGPTSADARIWATWLETDPDFIQYVPARVGAQFLERAERMVRAELQRWDDSPLSMGWSVALKSGDEFIGFAGVDDMGDGTGEIEYFLGRPYWRRGYASETAQAVTDYWFHTTDGQRMVAYVIPENVGSVRAVEKLGYQRTGSVNYLDLMGNPPGVVLNTPIADTFWITRDEWAQR
jgi:ribosomal-protein-alanine N-acetyltransferase